MRLHSHGTVLTLALALTSACKGAASEVAPPAAPAAALPAPDPKLARVPLSDRLVMEANSRPEEAIRAEPLSARLALQGVTFARKRQVLAGPIGASYCELSVTPEGLAVSLCEFRDASAASAGAAASRQTFDSLMPGRTLSVRGNTLLTLTHPEGETAERQAKLISAAFAEQTPTVLQTKTALAL